MIAARRLFVDIDACMRPEKAGDGVKWCACEYFVTIDLHDVGVGELGLADKFGDEARLADTGFAHDHHGVAMRLCRERWSSATASD